MSNDIREPEEVYLFDALATRDPSGAIERQEARGQAALVRSQKLPVRFNWPRDMTWEQVCAAWGCEVTGPVGDDIFQDAKLPAGWQIKSTGHSMWSSLVDDRGNERALIFYKAAFYDRDAFINLSCRFTRPTDYDGDYGPNQKRTPQVKDNRTGRIIHRGETVTGVGEETWRLDEKGEREVYAWLEEHYPDHRNPFAYWDNEVME